MNIFIYLKWQWMISNGSTYIQPKITNNKRFKTIVLFFWNDHLFIHWQKQQQKKVIEEIKGKLKKNLLKIIMIY